MGMEPRNPHFNISPERWFLESPDRCQPIKYSFDSLTWNWGTLTTHNPLPLTTVSLTPSPQKACFHANWVFTTHSLIVYFPHSVFLQLQCPLPLIHLFTVCADFDYLTRLPGVSISLQVAISPYTELQICLPVSFAWQLVMCCLLTSSVSLFCIFKLCLCLTFQPDYKPTEKGRTLSESPRSLFLVSLEPCLIGFLDSKFLA